jgi:outer membrane murein-binding lipoprotein Lpp
MIQDILAERQIPNRAEMDKIIEQLDNLAAKLDELDRDQD